MLHITNGESVSLDRAGVPGRIIFWADPLTEGPVPAGLSLEEMSRVRERFLGNVSLAERDDALLRFRDHEEVVLWFEHDLYDQLHLLQLLDWFSHQDRGTTKLSLICRDRYLGHLPPEELRTLFPGRHEVTGAEFHTAQKAWRAFRAPEPSELLALTKTGTSVLPFLHAALLRHLEQFPGLHDGLARTERQALRFAEAGLHEFAEMFQADQQLEESIYMGDTTYRQYLQRLTHARHPLLVGQAVLPATFDLTDFGRKVLAQQEDHIRLNGINRWLGGVHLCEGAPIWRWDANRRTIAP
jgi:hypothetical protein